MFNQPNLIGASTATATNPFLPPLQRARAAGPIEEYTFVQIKPKKKLKEINKVLNAEQKKFIFKYGWKFNLKDRCVVCGVHHVWDSGDYMRPPIPLSHVYKGRPMRGTYCPKHATHHRQLEMLQQQMIADEHGLEFKGFNLKPRLPQVLTKGALTTLSRADVFSLTSTGWVITPPATKGEETPPQEVVRLSGEMKLAAERMQFLIEKGD